MTLIPLFPERKPLPETPPTNEAEVRAACEVQGWTLEITENKPTAKKRRYGYALHKHMMTNATIGTPCKTRDEAAVAAWESATHAGATDGMYLLGRRS